MPDDYVVNLLGEFKASHNGRPLALPPSCQRVIALAALKRRAVHRPWVCSVLWPYAPPRRAIASLRSALWRLRPLGADGLLVVDAQHLALAPGVAVDFHHAMGLIEQLLDRRPGSPVDPDLAEALEPVLSAGELLEGWSDRWCGHQRSRYTTMRLIARDVLRDGAETQVAGYACTSHASIPTLEAVRHDHYADHDDSSQP